MSIYTTKCLTYIELLIRAENKPNDFVPLESNSRLFIYGNGSVEIKNAERQHEGFYSCQADNGIGTPIAKTVLLKVNSKL